MKEVLIMTTRAAIAAVSTIGVIVVLLLGFYRDGTSWNSSPTDQLCNSCLHEELTSMHHLKTPQDLTITAVHWREEADGGATLGVCIASAPLPEGNVTLVFGIVNVTSVTVPANVNSNVNDSCVEFSLKPSIKVPQSLARYEVVFYKSQAEVTGRGSTTFEVPVKVTYLNCSQSTVIKVSWEDTTTLSFEDCIEGSDNFIRVCYLNKRLDMTSFCFNVSDTKNRQVNICLPVPTDEDLAYKVDDVLSVNYLAYRDFEEGPATLSMSFGRQPVNQLRVIYYPPGNGTVRVLDCPQGRCSLEGYAPAYAALDLCGDAADGAGATLQSATATIIDLNLHTLLARATKSMSLQFVFANGLPSEAYTAALYPTLPTKPDTLPTASVLVDCNHVQEGHACYGFLDTGNLTGLVYLAISNAENGSNDIISNQDTGIRNVVFDKDESRSKWLLHN